MTPPAEASGATGAAAALSVHPVAAAALGEVAGEVLETLGGPADLAVVVAGGAHAASLGSISDAVGDLLSPGCLLSIGASGTLGAGTAAPSVPSVALWAVTGIEATALPATAPDGTADTDAIVSALPTEGTLVVVGTGGPPLPRLVEAVARQHPGLDVVGGLVDASPDAPGRVGTDGRTDSTLAGFLLPPGVATAIGAGAVRPVGETLAVTDAEGPVVRTLAGAPAADHLDAVVADLTADARMALRRGVFLCRVVDERGLEPGAADVVAHGVRGLVADTRWLALDAAVEVGTLVRFGYLDPATATSELRHALTLATAGRPSAGAFLFSCVARGAGLLDDDAHDAVLAAETLRSAAVAGTSCTGEVAPTGRRAWLSGFTAAALVVHAEGPDPLG